MLFNIEADTGDLIIGYLVPDTFNGQASLAVFDDDKEVLRVQTSEPRPALVAAGRHETGLCGFTISDADLPGLSRMTALELRDVESDVAIYRRCNPDAVIHSKVFRLETHLLALSKLDRVLRHRFQFYFPSVERFGLETVQQMFLMNNTASVMASGRVAYRSIEHFLEQGYQSIVVLHDPYEELAERLLVFRLLSGSQEGFLPMRDRIAFEHAIAFASSLPLESDRQLKRAFRNLDPAIVASLSDPLTRQIANRSPDEPLTVSSVGVALSILSSFGVVGLRRRSEFFTEAIVHRFSLHDGELPAVDRIPQVTALADRLRTFPAVERLIEHDLGLYHFVSDAFEKSLRTDTAL